MRAIDADRLKEHIDKLPALPDGNFAGNHSALKALINMQPSVESERKTGKWKHMVGWWECNQCHAEYTDMPTCMGKVIYEYCPMCGARMEEET